MDSLGASLGEAECAKMKLILRLYVCVCLDCSSCSSRWPVALEKHVPHNAQTKQK